MQKKIALDESKLISHIICDVQRMSSGVLSINEARTTINAVRNLCSEHGLKGLTQVLPSIGKALDKGLITGTFVPPNTGCRIGYQDVFPTLWQLIFNEDNTLRSDCDAKYVRHLRQILYLFYKYELPYETEQQQQVLDRFERNERDLSSTVLPGLEVLQACVDKLFANPRSKSAPRNTAQVVRNARALLRRVFRDFDYTEIVPRHGPGAVATRQQLWGKYQWTNVSERVATVYPIDQYFYVNATHLCDTLGTVDDIRRLGSVEHPARVILVPKDSRGPRLISCEPVDKQWIQQGLGRALVDHVEKHPLTKWNVFFTDQGPNQRAALWGSQQLGRISTLDLQDASDRVSLSLVRLLWPEDLYMAFCSCRSSETMMPDGRIMPMLKHAPMGSGLCFPVMALTIWALLRGIMTDEQAQCLLVYGDDIIVPSVQTQNAITVLTDVGLLVNRDKSCISGLFKESCGVDAFKGENVTPCKLKTVWNTSRSPSAFVSWVAYANSFYERKLFSSYDYIVKRLGALYGPIPGPARPAWTLYQGTQESVVRLSDNSLAKGIRNRYNEDLQKWESYVLCVSTPVLKKTISGWSMLLRFFTEGCTVPLNDPWVRIEFNPLSDCAPFSVSSYTQRNRSVLRRCWR